MMYLFVFVLGVVFGSFFNVVLFRFHTGKTIRGRSICLSCGHQLRWYELIPLLSYLFQRGRCASCKTKLSFQYPFVEISSGLLAVLAFVVSGASHTPGEFITVFQALLGVSLLWLLLLIAVYDIRHKIIPDEWAILLTLVGLIEAVCVFFNFFPYHAWNALIPELPRWFGVFGGTIWALPLALIYFFSGRRAIGFGDVKLMFALGLFFGFTKAFTIFALAFWVGSVPSIYLLLVAHTRFTMKSELPFAPFLVIATLSVYALDLNIFNWML